MNKIPKKNMPLKKNTIYLVCRGTKKKSGLIAEKYNLNDRKSTHVGIGFFENDELKIYHVTNTKTYKGSALIIDDLNCFLDQKSVYYLGIWACHTNIIDFEKAKRICEDFASLPVKFDKSFLLDNKNQLYCSEFCHKVLNLTNPVIFDFSPSKIKLDEFYRLVLKRDFLIYYPIDFFQQNKKIFKIYECEY